ncbi:MAG: hypothetical protein ACYTHM_21390 [Planctomycetota bacterium]|jgi:hypothetical protein
MESLEVMIDWRGPFDLAFIEKCYSEFTKGIYCWLEPTEDIIPEFIGIKTIGWIYGQDIAGRIKLDLEGEVGEAWRNEYGKKEPLVALGEISLPEGKILTERLVRKTGSLLIRNAMACGNQLFQVRKAENGRREGGGEIQILNLLSALETPLNLAGCINGSDAGEDA